MPWSRSMDGHEAARGSARSTPAHKWQLCMPGTPKASGLVMSACYLRLAGPDRTTVAQLPCVGHRMLTLFSGWGSRKQGVQRIVAHRWLMESTYDATRTVVAVVMQAFALRP